MYIKFVILCAILPQIIIGNFADQVNRKSTDLHRQKRVISYLPGEDKKVAIREAPYIVHIKHLNRISCVGSILSHHVVITIASCVPFERSEYRLVSKSSLSDRGSSHNITDVNRKSGGHPGRSFDGVALLTVTPSFVFGDFVNNIRLYTGTLVAGTLGTVLGWGYCYRGEERGTKFPIHLRSIDVPIITHSECVNRYHPHGIEISEMDVCTYQPQRHCGHNDGGAPLVIDYKLAGIHLWTGTDMRHQSDPEHPDVFAVLQHHEYLSWILSTMNAIEAQHDPLHFRH